MDAHVSPRRARGFTLIELLVVISIIAILAGLLIPTIAMVRNLAGQMDDGNDQRQIGMAAMTYMNDYDGQWPAVYVTAAGVVSDRANADPLATAVASFELLAFETGGELPSQIFQSRGMPTFRPSELPDDIRTSGTSTWAASVAADDANTPGYAYDWSIPANAGSQRVVTASRGHGTWDGVIVGLYADGHTQKWKAQRNRPSAGGSYQLDDLVDPTGKAWIAHNPMNGDAIRDNVFDDEGDGGQMNAIGRGDPKRAAVK